MCTPHIFLGGKMARGWVLLEQGMLLCNTSWMVDEGWQAVTMAMEDEAQVATMQLLGGGVKRR